MLLLLCKWPIGLDLYLLKFAEGIEVPEHTDVVKGKKHYRVNIILKRPKSGGEFVCSKTILNLNRVKVFRPDLYAHSVTKIRAGSRFCLSIGVAI